MYSYEDRIRAVTLYIKLGKRAGATNIHGQKKPACSSLLAGHAHPPPWREYRVDAAPDRLVWLLRFWSNSLGRLHERKRAFADSGAHALPAGLLILDSLFN